MLFGGVLTARQIIEILGSKLGRAVTRNLKKMATSLISKSIDISQSNLCDLEKASKIKNLEPK
jgi:hypothetical protein